MSEQFKGPKRKAKPLLMAGAGIALLTMASGSLSCGNLPARSCGDGGVQDPCAQNREQPNDEPDGGSDGGVLGGDR
ncbi:MAG: hypothetical protein Q8L14_11260 [Myxococcales bacterium]|nr:hypothetical protein [Myxococcales bacterium]